MTSSRARSVVALSALSVIGIGLGFAREALMAAYLGANARTDAFFVAMIPVSLLLMSRIDFSIAFIPLYLAFRERAGREAAQRFARTTGVAIALLVAALIGALLVGAHPFVDRLAPGLEVGAREEARIIIFLLTPILAAIPVIALSGAILNAVGVFSRPGVYNLLPNLGIVLGIVLLSGRFGVRALAGGLVVGYLGQLLLQCRLMWRGGWEIGLKGFGHQTRGEPRRAGFQTEGLARLGFFLAV